MVSTAGRQMRFGSVATSGKLLCKYEVVAEERFYVCLHFMGENPISQGSMCGLPSLIHSTVLHLLYDSALKAPLQPPPQQKIYLHTLSQAVPLTQRNTNTYFKREMLLSSHVSRVRKMTRVPFYRVYPNHLISHNVNRAILVVTLVLSFTPRLHIPWFAFNRM